MNLEPLLTVNKTNRGIIISVGLFLFILLADRISKMLVVRNLQGKSFHVMPFVDLVYVTNKGIVFGLFSGSNINFLILSSISLIIITLLLIFWFKPIPYPLIAMILAGGTGNLIDRFLYGHVVDFIKVDRFYVFNIADASITISIILFLWFFLFRHHGTNTV